MIMTMLNTAEPRIVPTPAELSVLITVSSDVDSSGALPPAAISVAPATSLLKCSSSAMTISTPSK